MRRITISACSILILILIVGVVLSQYVYAGLDEGLRAYKRGDYVTALKELELSAEQGDARAQYNLGSMYYNGEGITRNYKEAFKWFRKASEQGNASAQYKLGVMYYEGKGVTRDEMEALKWWRKAAEQGDVRAQKRLHVPAKKAALKRPPKPVPAYPTLSVPTEKARIPVKDSPLPTAPKDAHLIKTPLPSAPKSIDSALKSSKKASLPRVPASPPVAERSAPVVNVDAEIMDEASNNIDLDEYKVVLGVDAVMKIPGIPGALKVWIGAEDSEPKFPETMREARDTVPAVGKSARVTPLAPAFEVEPKESGCMQIHPDGSEKTFYLTPKKKGTFSVGAEVNLFNYDNCGGAPIPRATRTLKVEVVVDTGEVIGEHTKELWDVFWEKLVDFWAALLVIFFGVLLFLIRGRLKIWFGYKKD